jgi:hypothetical protein
MTSAPVNRSTEVFTSNGAAAHPRDAVTARSPVRVRDFGSRRIWASPMSVTLYPYRDTSWDGQHRALPVRSASLKRGELMASAKTEFLHIRLTKEDEARLKEAAKKEHLDTSTWARRALLLAAEKILEERE